MIKVIQKYLYGQIVSIVMDTDESPPKILGIRAGEYSDHERTCASYHAKRRGQDRFVVWDTDDTILQSVKVKK